ncbi:MAG: Uracil phosphoribosyltransferase [Tenericutes bacterium ADurb.Bin087]|nr:MAG: Uracil phosphoribosyltransferase [Tenericutes bacterium ADurb.Bin087]
MVFEIKHPLIAVKLSIMRDEKTKSKEFRESLDEIASLMSYEIFKDIGTYPSDDTFMTPTGIELQKIKLNYKIILVPILRAGIGMVDGIRNMIPTARIGHIGIYRDEKTLEPHEYYFKLPKVENPLVVLVDPMLATGGSAVAAISAIKARGYNNIRMATLVASPIGIERVSKAHPDVNIYVAAIDEKLNEHGYILPGLGDAGDRIFGTR